MRISEKALENIRAVIEQQETEWLKDNGFDPVPYRPEPRMRKRKLREGNFSADRFLGSVAAEPAHEPEAPQQDNTPEAVEIIPQKDGRHSWLYNEVMKAIHDAAGDGKNTKVIAIFVPVVQNGKEFEDLPVSASVELSPVQEEDVRIEELVDVHAEADGSEEIPEPEEEHISETLEGSHEEEPVQAEEPEAESETFTEPEQTEPEQEEELQEEFSAPAEPEPEELSEAEETAFTEPKPEAEPEPEPQEEIPDISEPEPEIEPEDHIGDLLPAGQSEPDPELAEAFNTMEEKLGEQIAESNEEEESEPEIMRFMEAEDSDEGEEPSELLPLPDPADIEGFGVPEDTTEPESEQESFDAEEIIDEPEEISAGEKMSFTEITLPEALEDDEVINEGIEPLEEDDKDHIRL